MNYPKYPINIGIYKITSPKGLVYIGQSINIFKRLYSYKKNLSKSQRKLYNSINKYGWQNHDFKILRLCRLDELTKWEQYYIDLFDSRNQKFGLNIRGAGYKGQVSKETKGKISKKNKGKLLGRSGILCHNSIKVLQFSLDDIFIKEWECISEIQRELGYYTTNISKCCKGRLNHAYGYNWRYKKMSDMEKEFKPKEQGRKKRSVLQIDNNGDVIKIWDYINEIHKTLGFLSSNIVSVCKGRQKTANGFIWKYNNEIR